MGYQVNSNCLSTKLYIYISSYTFSGYRRERRAERLWVLSSAKLGIRKWSNDMVCLYCNYHGGVARINNTQTQLHSWLMAWNMFI